MDTEQKIEFVVAAFILGNRFVGGKKGAEHD